MKIFHNPYVDLWSYPQYWKSTGWSHSVLLEKEFGPEPNSYHKMKCHASPTKSDWVCILGNTFITYFFFFFFFLLFWLLHAACGILVLWLGNEPAPPELEAWSLNHWTTRQVPLTSVFKLIEGLKKFWLFDSLHKWSNSKWSNKGHICFLLL